MSCKPKTKLRSVLILAVKPSRILKPCQSRFLNLMLMTLLQPLSLLISVGFNNHNLTQTYAEAMASTNATDWQAAWDSEFSSLAANDVYKVVRTPDGVKPVTSTLVLAKLAYYLVHIMVIVSTGTCIYGVSLDTDIMILLNCLSVNISMIV
jgi:hypothetical protein